MKKSVRRAFAAAALPALLAGLVTAPPAAAAAAAMLSGTVTAAATGTPVANACVTVYSLGLGYEWTRVCTGADGRYQVNGMPHGVRIKIQIQAPGFVERWSDDAPDERNATVLTMNDTQPAVADFALRTDAGSIEGLVRDPGGQVASTARVTLKLAGGAWSASGETEPDGRYRFDRIPPGVYDVTIARADLAPQTFPGVTIQADQVTVRNFAFAARTGDPPSTGRMVGRITDGPGGPGVGGATVVLFKERFTEVARATTDDTGAYVIDRLPLDRLFRVRASAPGFAEVWASDSPDFGNAAGYLVTPTYATQVSIPLRRGSGTIRGQITDPAGAGVRATIEFFRLGQQRTPRIFTRLDGTYEQPNLAPGNYQVSVTASGLGRQWVRGKEQQADAELIPVTNQGTTTVDEQFRPRGILEVVVVDAISGAPIFTNCMYLHATAYNSSLCTGTDGVYRFSDVPPGLASVRVASDGSHLGTHSADLAVHSAQTTRTTLRLRPAGMITTTVRRAADGSVPRTCAYVVPVGLAQPSPIDDGSSSNGWCNTDDQGKTVETLTIGPVAAEPMQIFVGGDYDKHGAQWLGATGGTGDRRLAAVITPRQGQSIPAPPIKLDPAGEISGFVRDRASGTPLVGAFVRPFGIVSGLQMQCGNLPHYTACTGQDGHYRLNGLGPYSWPVEFAADGHANQWSGGATDRFGATLVPVKPGDSTPLHASLGVEAKFTNFNRGLNPAQYWSVVAYHPTTGDMVNSAWYGGPNLGGLSAGPVVLRYTPRGADSCWYASTSGTPDHPRRPTVPGVLTVSTGQTIDGLPLIPGSTCLSITTSREPIPRRPDTMPTLPGAELVPAGTAVARDFAVQDRAALPDLTAGEQAPSGSLTPIVLTPVPRH